MKSLLSLLSYIKRKKQRKKECENEYFSKDCYNYIITFMF